MKIEQIFKIISFAIAITFISNVISFAQVSDREWRSYGSTNDDDVQRKVDGLSNAISKAIREHELKQSAKTNAAYIKDAAMLSGESAMSTIFALNQELNYIKPEEFMDKRYVNTDYQPHIIEHIDLHSRYENENGTSFLSESILRNNSENIHHILSNYDLETIQHELIPIMRQELDYMYHALENATPGSTDAIILEREIGTSERDLRSLEDAVKAGSDRSWLQNMPPKEFKHNNGFAFYSREVVEDILDPMEEGEFLEYCLTKNKDIKEKYTGYSDYYMAESCEVVDGKLVSRIFFTNIRPEDNVKQTDNVEVSRIITDGDYERQLHMSSINQLDEEIRKEEIELAKKEKSLDILAQTLDSLEKQSTSNLIHALDDLTQIVKNTLEVDLNMLNKIIPGGRLLENIYEPVENKINDMKDDFLDEGMEYWRQKYDVKKQPHEYSQDGTMDKVIKGYENVNEVYKSAKKILPTEISKLDKVLRNVPSQVSNAIARNMFFITNRKELGSAAGLAGANITIYGIKNEYRQQLENKKNEVEHKREKVKRLKELRQRMGE